MLDNSVLKIGAKIYEATTLGPYCKVGGEVNNTVFLAILLKHMMVLLETQLLENGVI